MSEIGQCPDDGRPPKALDLDNPESDAQTSSVRINFELDVPFYPLHSEFTGFLESSAGALTAAVDLYKSVRDSDPAKRKVERDADRRQVNLEQHAVGNQVSSTKNLAYYRKGGRGGRGLRF